MPCPICGAGTTMYAPGGAIATKYACGWTPEDIALGRHPQPAERRHSRPVLVVLTALIVLAVANLVTAGTTDTADMTTGETAIVVQLRTLLVTVEILGLFVLYALWRVADRR